MTSVVRIPRDNPYEDSAARRIASSTEFEAGDRCDGPEDLLRVCRGRQRHVGEHRRAVEEIVIGAAGGEPGPRIHTAGHVVVDPVPLAGVDDRAEGDGSRRRVTHGQPVGAGRQGRHVLVRHAGLHEVPARGHAHLTLVGERTPGADRRCCLDIDVIEDEKGRVAAELEVHALEMLSREHSDGASHLRRAGERDGAYQRGGDECLTDLGTTGQHVQEAVRQARLGEQLSEDGSAADRGARVRLEQDGVAERQGGCHRPDGQDRRHVEGCDHADDPGGDPAGQAEALVLRREQLAVRCGGKRGGLIALLGRRHDLELAERTDRSGLAHQPADDLLGVPVPQVARASQHGGSLDMRCRGPRLLRLRGPGGRSRDISLRRPAHRAE